MRLKTNVTSLRFKMKKVIILLSFIILAFSQSDTELDSIKTYLFDKVDSKMFSKNIELTYFGSIQNDSNSYKIYISKLVWAQSQRLTTRILIFSQFRYLGQYSHISEDPIKIVKNKIIFPIDKEFGNSINLNTAKPPKQIYIDGEIHEFYN